MWNNSTCLKCAKSAKFFGRIAPPDFYKSNYRVAINDFVQGLDIQSAFFKLGYSWADGGVAHRDVRGRVILAMGSLLYVANESDFEQDFATEITLADLQKAARKD
jgi:hypothetical protein